MLACAAALGIEILWLTTHAPWRNPIEWAWRWRIEDLPRHHAQADRFP